MKRKLTFDPKFKPISYTGDREREFFPNGIFLFDITALDEHIRSHQDEFVVIDVEVDRYYTDDRVMGVKELKEDHIEASDLNRPIIFVEIAPDRLEKLTGSNRDNLFMRGYNLIDGHHRIAKAHRLGHKTLKAYIVRMEQHLPFMLEGYKEYVGYWNEKLKDF